jgi:hypothetical protein
VKSPQIDENEVAAVGKSVMILFGIDLDSATRSRFSGGGSSKDFGSTVEDPH